MKKKRLFKLSYSVFFLMLISVTLQLRAQQNLFGTRTGSAYNDNSNYELGTVFNSSVDGQITAVRVYAVAGESGNHTIRVWRNSNNTVIAGPYSWSYNGNNAWITFNLPTALNILSNVDYTVAISTGEDAGKYYTALPGDVSSAGSNGDQLSWPANAGVYSTNLGSRPTSTWNGNNYLRDVVFVAEDVTPPSAPTNLAATAVSPSQINLTWTASTDNVGVTGYQVFRDGGSTPVATVTEISFNDIGLSENTTYSYTVKAIDDAENISVASNTASATTLLTGGTNLALNKPVTVSSVENSTFPGEDAVDGSMTTRWSSQYSDPQWIQIDLETTVNISQVKLYWEVAYSSSYQIQVSDNGSTWTNIYSTASSDGGLDDITGISGSGRYIRMYGLSRGTPWGHSLWEFEVYGTTGGFQDTIPPTAPSNLAASAVSSSQINLVWDASTDNIGVTEYRIFRDGTSTPLASVSGLSYSNTGLSESTSYSYTVKAVDAAGNLSSASNIASATTLSDGGSQTPQIFQEFDPWVGTTSPDGIWVKSGVWVGTGGNTLYPDNITFTDTYTGESGHGFMYLKSEANTLNGSEIRTFPSKYKYGYYEVRMKVTDVGDPSTNRGVCASFFLWDDNNGSFELDFEFLTNLSWINSPNSGQVTLNYHLPDGTGNVHTHNLPFNPSHDFHRYGFLWQPGQVDWTVDGEIVYSVNNPQFTNNNTEYIMLNSWTGNPNWGGLSPTEDAITVYDWVKFYPDVTSVPGGDGSDDTVSPTAPTNLTAVTVSSSQINLSWNASIDNVGVTGYQIFRDGGGTPIATVTGTSFNNTGLSDNNTYSYIVKAMDAADNISAASNTALATTLPDGGGTSLPLIPWEGGPTYYSSSPQAVASGWTDSEFFPIGVWFESVLSQSDIDLDKAAGLNTYVELTNNSDVSLIRNNDMYTISGLSGIGDETVAHLLTDEADMIYGPGSDAWSGEYGWNTCIPIQDEGGKCGYTVMQTLSDNVPSDGRFKYANYGKGVMMWESDVEAAHFINNYQHIVSSDLYFYTDPNLCPTEAQSFLGIPSNQCRLSANYGLVMDKMRELDVLNDTERIPIYAFVEVGHPFTEYDAPTINGDQIAGAVMNSLIHEARGIIYFNHNFGGECISQHVLRDACGAAIRPKVIETNSRITQLAPVLNTQSFQWSFNSNVDAMLKYYNGNFYIFAMLKRGVSPGTYTFTLPEDITGSTANVMFEGRSRSISSGQFSDTFNAEYSYHIYQISGISPAIKSATNVDNISEELSFKAFPNPFNSSTVIEVSVKNNQIINDISIYDIQGKLLKSFDKSDFQGDNIRLTWGGVENSKNPIKTGIYLVKVQLNNEIKTFKLLKN